MAINRDRPAPLVLSLCPGGDAAPAELARLRFGGSGSPVRVPLAPLAGPVEEVLHAPPPVTGGEAEGIGYAAADAVCFGYLVVAEAGDDIAAAAETAYRRLIALQDALGYGHLLRIWHCLHAINHGDGEDERYKRFCAGRARVLDEHPAVAERLPAATVVGGDEPGLQMHFLLTRTAPTPIENPRQVSAYRYPSEYGRRRPAFARATCMDWPRGNRQLFISGTASIVGHATRHAGDTGAQLEEALANVAVLLAEAGPAFERIGLTGLDQLKVYLRHRADLPAVRRVLAERIGAVPWVCLRADLCRDDLLVEVEAVASA